MKKIIFPLLVTILSFTFTSCHKEDRYIGPLPTDNYNNRTEKEAIDIANNIVTLSKSRADESLAIENIKTITSIESNSIPLIYVINYENDGGYALVSASKSGIDVLGYSDNGNLDLDEVSENENFNYFLDVAKQYVISTFGIGDFVPNPELPKTITSEIFPKLQVEWGQSYPEGIYCPNKIAGCVQTAMAQIMSYIEFPKSIEINYPGADVAVQLLNWENIKKHKKSTSNSQSVINQHLSDCEADESTHNAIGRLCRQLGYLNFAYYYSNSTTASSDEAYITFKSLCPNYKFTDFVGFNSDFNNLFDSLFEHNGIAYVRGKDLKAGGHAWVCDGARRIQTTYTSIKSDGSKTTVTTNEYYYHYNWGWNGKANGYFAAGVFNMNDPNYDFSYSPRFFVVYK